MLLNSKTENFIDLNNSFSISEDFVSGLFGVETGACFSHLSGNSIVISGDFSNLKKDIYLGISRQLRDFSATGVDVYTASQREEQKDSEGAFWTWISLVDENGQIFGLDSDIVLDSGCSLQGPYNSDANVSFEHYENESILRLSYKESNQFDSDYISETFEEVNDNQVLYRQDEEENDEFEHFLVPLDQYETGQGRTAIGIVNFGQELLTRL